MSEQKGEMIEIAALWNFKSGNGAAGKLGNARILVLPNKQKKADNHPDYRVFVVKDEKKPNPYAGQGADVGTTPTVRRQENYGTKFDEDSIPF